MNTSTRRYYVVRLMQSILTTNAKHQPNVESMLIYCLRYWPNVDQTMGQCLMFAGL